MNKPREFWITPTEEWKRTAYSTRENLRDDTQWIHVIEYSAVASLQRELSEAEGNLHSAIEWYKAELEILRKERDDISKSFDEMQALANESFANGLRERQNEIDLVNEHSLQQADLLTTQVLEIGKLHAELEQEKKYTNQSNDVVEKQKEVICGLRADLKLAVDALKSYAGMPMRTSDGSKYSYDSNSFENDKGTQAREALAKLTKDTK